MNGKVPERDGKAVEVYWSTLQSMIISKTDIMKACAMDVPSAYLGQFILRSIAPRRPPIWFALLYLNILDNMVKRKQNLRTCCCWRQLIGGVVEFWGGGDFTKPRFGRLSWAEPQLEHQPLSRAKAQKTQRPKVLSELVELACIQPD